MRTACLILALTLFCAVGTSLAPAQDLASRAGDFGISANLWLDGDVYLARWDVDVTKESGLLLHAFYDAYLVEKLSMGLYGHYASVSLARSNTSVSMYEIGMTIKPRFIIADGAVAIKPALHIGYRTSSSDDLDLDGMNGMGLDASLQVQINSSGAVIPFFEFGFLSQPVGGVKDVTDISWAPIIYLGAGVVLQ